MDVKAIILVGAPAPNPGESGGDSRFSVLENQPAERIGDVPIALLDVLGKPVLHRIADQLKAAGVSAIHVVSDTTGAADPYVRAAQRDDLNWQIASSENLWQVCEKTFSDCAQGGADLVLVFRLGPFHEIDYDKLVQFHLDVRSRVTCVMAPASGAGVFVISASRRNDAAFLFRHQLLQCRVAAVEYEYEGYLNRLRDAADLRRLASDGLCGAVKIEPAGRQAKPGVWVGEGARIHPKARLLAPAYIGARARVRAAAVITRSSVIEHHAEVDCGTVVENSTILPYSYVGAGLDVSHSVVGFNRLAHLLRGVDVAIGDPKLVAMASTSAPLRVVAGVAGLAAFLPMQLFRGMFAKSHREPPVELPASAEAPATALEAPAAAAADSRADVSKFPANVVVVARRYGNE